MWYIYQFTKSRQILGAKLSITRNPHSIRSSCCLQVTRKPFYTFARRLWSLVNIELYWVPARHCQGLKQFCSWNVHNMKFYTLYLVWNIDQLCPIDIVHFRVCIVLVSAKLLGGTIDGYRAVSSHNLTTKHRVFSLWPSLTKWRSAEKLHPSWSNTCSIVPAKKIMGSDADSLPPDTREMLTAVFRCQ